MQDEIFGPILPLIEYESVDEVVSAVHQKATPLALYLFSESEEVQQQIINTVSFGEGALTIRLCTWQRRTCHLEELERVESVNITVRQALKRFHTLKAC